jgi:hypothetical protein
LAIIGLILVLAIGFIAIGGSVSLPQSVNPSVPQQTIYIYVNTTPVIVEKTVLPTPVPTRDRSVHSVPTDTPKNRPVLITDASTPEIDWRSIQGSLSKEDIAFWIGRSGSSWGQSTEIIYQKIASDIKEYRNRVVVKSAMFRKMIYSQKGVIHLATNVSIGDLSEVRDVKIATYSMSFKDPRDNQKIIKMVFFYDDRGDIIAFGYGDSIDIVTKSNFVTSSDSDSSNSDGFSGGGGGDEVGGPSEPVIQ